MQKIFELTEKEFATGIAPSSHSRGKGLWRRANGITIFRDIFLESENNGVLQAAPSPSDITGSVVVDVPWWATTRVTSSVSQLYIGGNAGHLYRIDLTTDGNPTDLRGAGGSNPAAGGFYLKHSTGAEYIYYLQLTQLGRYGNLASGGTTFTDNYDTGWQSTAWHPRHPLFDRHYIGNGRYIASVYDDGSGGLTINKTALNFAASERVNCISDDGTYLVAGVTDQQSTLNTVLSHSRVIFWDTNQLSWQREWPIPDAAIYSIQRVGTVMRAVTSRGVFDFTFDSPPVPLLPYTTSATTPDYSYPGQYAADVFGGAIAFGGSGRVSTFGKVLPHLPTAFHQPFSGFTGTVSLVVTSAKITQAFVGTTSSKLYRVIYSDAGQTGLNAESVFIDLARWWQIGKVVLGFDGQLASSDDVSLTLTPDDATGATTWGSATYAANGAIRTKELYKSLEARELKLLLNFNGGTPRIRFLEVWGDPIETPTHIRV